MKLGLFIFNRDLRIFDNQTLFEISKKVDKIIPIFIFNPMQIKKTKFNKYYFSQNAVQFLCESVIDLYHQVKKQNGTLQIFYGNPTQIVEQLCKKIPEIEIVAFHKDFSDFAINRQRQMQEICDKYHVTLYTGQNDFSLYPIKELCRKNFQGHKQFGSFLKHCKKMTITKIQKNKNIKFHTINPNNLQLKKKNVLQVSKIMSTFCFHYNYDINQTGGRKSGLKKISKIKNQKKYNTLRDILSYQTTEISGYLNFGCLSVREVYEIVKNKLSKNSKILTQLHWRDFYLQAVVFLPNGNQFDYMDKRYNKIKWKNNKNDWEKIITGKTGYLVVDAGIRQMISTGYMHNRARMIVGVFWTKYCLIDTFHEKYGSQVGFSKYLLDAVGISQNKLNHQWLTEFDYPGKRYAPKGISMAGRPMDISNKTTIKKFDPNCEYIKKYIPELKNVPNKELMNWDDEKYKIYKIHVPPMFPSLEEQYNDWIHACKLAMK